MKKLTANGNSWVLYINKSFADSMGITKDSRYVNLKFKNKVLYINLDVDNSGLLIKKLLKRGGGYGLIMTLPFLELLDINPEKDMVEVNIDENKLIIQKAIN